MRGSERARRGALACRCIVLPTMLCVYRPVYPAIDPHTAPAATRLKPSGENIVSDLASPPATTSLLLAMISYSTSRVEEKRVETRRHEANGEREGRAARGTRRGAVRSGTERGRVRVGASGPSGGTEGADSVRILDRSNGPYMLPLIEQQITGIVSRFYSKTTRYGRPRETNDARPSGN